MNKQSPLTNNVVIETLESDEDGGEDSVVVTMTTMEDSSSRRPRNTRHCASNSEKDTTVQSSSSLSRKYIAGTGGEDRNININSNNDGRNRDVNGSGSINEIIDLMEESETSLEHPPPRRANASGSASRSAAVSRLAVDLTGDDEEEAMDNDDDDDDRKSPARNDVATSVDGNRNGSNNDSDNDSDNDNEWSCPRCTLLNQNTTATCNVCEYRNIDIEHTLHHNNLVERQEQSMFQQQRASASSPLDLIVRGAVIGAAVGISGNWMHGRNLVSGALEGGATGAMGGALLHEVMQPYGNDNGNNNINVNGDRIGIGTETVTPVVQADAMAQTIALGARASARTEDSTYRIPSYPNSRSYPHYTEERIVHMQNSISDNESNYFASSRSSTIPAMGRAIASRPTSTASDSNSNAATYSYTTQPTFRAPYVSGPTVGGDVSEMTAVNAGDVTVVTEDNGADTIRRPRYHINNNRGDFITLRDLEARQRRNNSTNRVDVDAMNNEQLLTTFGSGTGNMGASEKEIRCLPVHVVEKNNPLPEDRKQCVICLEDFNIGDQRTILPCLHGFHQNCSRHWLKKNGTCPLCKHPVAITKQP
mmetsp:Transcript_23063/g.49111  ORF Transcript_23063/g.49111 Transcript_23063/m.49111 type:complete len:591 (-) Transcript_23063:1304-3076(-)